MGNETRHYFGAYLEIKLKQREVSQVGHYCTKKSRPEEDSWVTAFRATSDGYCSFCGKPVAEESRTVLEYPRSLVDYTDQSVLGEEFEDVLAELRVPDLHGKGIVLAVGNQADNSDWLRLNCSEYYTDEYPFPQFPNSAQIENMENSLVTVYAEAIAALKASPLVESVEVKAGYVLDQDY